jgi:hypothetical protein
MLIDGIDWYMQFPTPPREWGRQCLKVQGEFWVIVVGMFGSVYAGDNANCMAQFVCQVGREEYGLEGLDFFVDNFENVIPGFPNGECDWERAWREWGSLNMLFDRFGIRCHHRAPPARWIATVPGSLTDVDSHLGWCCDLQRQIAFVPDKKRPVIKRLVANWTGLEKYSLSDLESMVGFFLFLSLVLPFLKVHVGVLMKLKSKASTNVLRLGWKRKARCLSSPHARAALLMLLGLLQDWNWEAPVKEWGWRDGPDCTIHADAAVPKERGLEYSSAQWGRGAWAVGTEVGRQDAWFYAEQWLPPMIEAAKRKKALSAPFLEFANYVHAVMLAARKGSRRVMVIGDCQPALGWLEKLHANDAVVMDLLLLLARDMRLYGYEVRTTFVKREMLVVADSLSRNDLQAIRRLEEAGSRRMVSPELQVPESREW